MKQNFTQFSRLLLCLLLCIACQAANAQVQLWGVTTKGGSNDYGTIYSYDLTTNAYTKHYDFEYPITPAGSLVEYHHKLYGIANGGIYCFDPASGTMNFYDTPGIHGTSTGTPTLLNDQFYFMTASFSASGQSDLIEYDPATNITTVKHTLDVNTEGVLPTTNSGGRNGKLTVLNGKLYGLAASGGTADLFGQTIHIVGTLFEYDPLANSFVVKMSFGNINDGGYYNPVGGLTVNDGLLYGICLDLNFGTPKLFSYDPAQSGTAGFSEKHDFASDAVPGYIDYTSYNGLLYSYNNILYGTTDQGGANNSGALYQYDPSGSGSFNTLYSFDNNIDGAYPAGGVIRYNNQFYGTTMAGGSLGNGTLYQLNPSTNTTSVLYAFGGNPDGASPVSELTLVVGQVAPTITFADFSKTYGDAVFTPTATSTDVATAVIYSIADGDNPDQVIALGADGKVTILKSGIAYITASQASTPLAATPIRVKLTVNKAVLTVNAKDQTLVINQPIINLPFEYTGWMAADNMIPDLITGKPVLTTTATQGSPVGAYPIVVSDVTGLTSDNYTFAVGAGATLTINATGSTAQTITFPTLPTVTYGDTDVALAASTDANGLTVSYSSSNTNVATIVNGKLHVIGAGTATITALQTGNVTYAPATDQLQTLIIKPATLTITADNKTINRGDLIPVLTVTYKGFVNGDDAGKLTVQPTITTTATVTSAPGVYTIAVSGAASPNYAVAFVDGKLTIKGTQLITWAPVSTLTYGDAPFNPGAVSDAGASFTPVYTTSNPSVISISGGQATIKGAGSAVITATFAAGNGFDLTTSTLPVTVLKKQLIITVDDKSRNYGEANPVFTYTYTGFVNSDNANTGALTTQPTASTLAIVTSPVGNYPVTVSGAQSNNYEPVYLNGNLEIKPVARMLTFNALPTKTYGDGDFNPSATVNTGEQVTYAVTDPAVASVTSSGQIHLNGAGTTTVTATLPVNSSYNGSTVATQTLTVNKAKLMITADNKTITQNSGDPLLTISFSGLVNGDTQLNLATRPVVTTSGKSNSPTGTYPITVSGAASNSYDISYVNGTLTVVFGVGQDQLVVHPMLSPNGDGLNDFMLIDGIQNYPDNHIVVINRNGAKVYEAKGYDNSKVVFGGKNADGNTTLVAGTYFYQIEYTIKGNQQRKTGYVVLKY